MQDLVQLNGGGEVHPVFLLTKLDIEIAGN